MAELSVTTNYGNLFLLLTTLTFLITHCWSGTPESSDPVIRKCCSLSQYYDEDTGQCEDLLHPLPSRIWSVLQNFSETGTAFNVTFQPENPPVCSKEIATVVMYSDDHLKQNPRFFIDEAGILREKNYDDQDYLLHRLHHLPEHYCIDVVEDSIVFRVCPARCDDKEPCYQQCCPHGSYLDLQLDREIGDCVESGASSPGRFPVFDHPDHSENEINNATPRITFGHKFLQNCETTVAFSTGWGFAERKLPFKILTNGSIVAYFEEKKAWVTLEKTEDYCVDRFYSNEEEMLPGGDPHVLYYCAGQVLKNGAGILNLNLLLYQYQYFKVLITLAGIFSIFSAK